MRGDIGSLFRIDGGDGDQSFFGRPMILRRVSEPWFPGKIPRGEAYLLRVINGRHADSYIAITSRVMASLADQFADRAAASVIVHVIHNPGTGFRPDLESADAIGMSFVEVL